MTSEEIAEALEILLDLPEGTVMIEGSGENPRISLSRRDAEEIVICLRGA